MNKIAFGQYYHSNSLIHRMDPRIKIIITMLFMISIFIVPTNNFILLSGLFLLAIIVIILTKVPLTRYLGSLKQIVFLLIFSFIFQVLFTNTGELLYTVQNQLTYVNIAVGVLVLIIYILIKKYLPLRFICFLLLIVGIVCLLQYPIYGKVLTTYNINIYSQGLINGSFIIYRVLILIMFTTVLTLTTKPTDLNNGLDSLLSPLEKMHIKTSIFSMMISIALRFIPTLFLEADKILKAQASRGVDFNESRLKEKIVQIVSLLVPMFIVSFKRAEDLAVAMEARGYVPGEKRSKINILKIKLSDILWLLLFIMVVVCLIIYRVI